MDPVAMVKTPHTVKELGPVQGEACRYFLLAADSCLAKSDLQVAVDQAARQNWRGCLVNVAVASGLYGFVPIYNLFSYTCTTVKGTAVKFEEVSPVAAGKIIKPVTAR